MRNFSGVFLLLLLCTGLALAKDSVSQSKTRLKGFLSTMASLEKEAASIQPMAIPLAKRTAKDDREMVRRVEFLDNLKNGKALTLSREIGAYQGQYDDSLVPAHTAVREANEAFASWLDAKLTLQNAGVNNPSLESLRKREPVTFQEYQKRWKAAQELLKS